MKLVWNISWKLLSAAHEDDASEALEIARKCVRIAKKVYEFYFV